ncbi:rhomboid family intramembrane serine protease [Nitratifractor sp.]
MSELRNFPLSYFLIFLNLLGYLWEVLRLGSFSGYDSQGLFACGALFAPAVVLGHEWWRLLSAMFLHGGLEHLALNMFSLLVVGRIMERFFDRWSYLSIYLLSGVGGFLASMAVHPGGILVGASGAIFGIFGALGGFFLFHRRRMGERFGIFAREFGVILGLNLILGLSIPEIDMSAHVAGLSLGFVGGYLAGRSGTLFVLYLLVALSVMALVLLCWLPGRYAVETGTVLFLPL